MKTSAVVIFFFLVITNSYGRILNGYASQIDDYYKSLHTIRAMSLEANNLSRSQRRNVTMRLDYLMNFISYHDLTNQLLLQLETISPNLYMEINNLKDLQGRDTDVYVKLIDQEKSRLPLMGATYFAQKPTDIHATVSTYGEFSVSIEIWMVRNSLKILYHELGHVRYLVPNLAAYTKFYHRRYSGPDPNSFGHHGNDQSGKLARAYEVRYMKDYTRYLKAGGTRFDSILTQLARLNKIQKTPPSILLPDRVKYTFSVGVEESF